MPPTLLAPMTELEAVNELLGSIGQAQINTLDSAYGDAATAQTYLDQVTRDVQLWGFKFNTDTAYPLTPDINGLLQVPSGAMRITSTDGKLDLTQRRHPSGSMCIWDLANRTWTFTAQVFFDISWAYGFEDLPQSARHYIAVAAARLFQNKLIGSSELDTKNQEYEQRAWNLLLMDERAGRKTNSFAKSPSLVAIRNRTGARGHTFP